MGVLDVVTGLLVTGLGGPVTSSTGGSSEGDSAAGTESDETEDEILFDHITTGHRVGAAILTVLVVGLISVATYTMVT